MLSDQFIYDTAVSIYDALPDNVTVPYPDPSVGVRLLNKDNYEELAVDLTAIIASLVGKLLDAGSERDAVQENLEPHVIEELKGWSDHADNEPTPSRELF